MRVAVLLLLALVVAGCSDDPNDSPDAKPSASGTPSQSPTTTPPPPAPAEDACYLLTADELTEPTNSSTAVSCRSPHNAQTIFVGKLRLVVDGHAIAVDSPRVTKQIATACPARLAAFVGGEQQDRDLSRLRVVWFSPTLAEADAGARWFRCDLIAFGTGDELLVHQRRVPRGVLATPQGRERYALCGTAAPGSPTFQRVVCSAKHTWRAVSTIAIEGGAKYPGQAAVRASGDSDCADAVRERQDFPLEFTYGWEWPTREQWKSGQRFGICWGPNAG